MNLACRPLEDTDLEPCLALAAGDYAEHPDSYPNAAAVYRRLLATGQLNGMVLDDLSRPPGARMAAFGMSVFVTPEYIEDARRGKRPGPAAQLVQCLTAGGSPVLTPEGVRRANSGPGLHVLVLHYAEADGPAEWLAHVRDKRVETFFYLHGGYRFAEMLVEHREPWVHRFMQEGGFHVRAEYEAFYRTHPHAPQSCPVLFGITRAETLPHPGLNVAKLFVYTAPRLYFKPREQALLQRALLDETDEEMAAALGISVAAVKKRWAGIYDHAAAMDSELFPEQAREGSASPGLARRGQEKRGQEKRRHLLRYLRIHPEELRPVERL